MRAVRVNEWAQPVQLEDIPRPDPADDEVLVKVHAASVNPIDGFIQAGYVRDYFTTPMTLGVDFAGEVVATGKDVTHVKPGDDVYGINLGFSTFAEYVAAKGQGVAPRPRTLDDVSAAAAGLAGVVAYQALFNAAKLQSGERVLIHGAGGGVGLFAVQLAKSRGATVVAHDKRNKEALVRGLGADEFIAAEDQPFEEVCGVVDVVLDLVPMGFYTDRSYLVCGPGARYVTPASQPPQEAAERGGFTAIGTVAQAALEDLNELAAAIDAGQVKVFVEKTFPLAEVEQAMAYRQKGGLSGKVVLVVP
jgi:NADPH:quinone reductase-like Zn-dependent oxidoreductase